MTADVIDRTAAVPGGSISILEGGAGRPLLVLHPAGGAGAWMPYHEMLAQHFRVIAPDSPGFGRSAQIESVEGVDDLAFLYADLIAKMGLQDPMVLGFSFGGWVAAELAVLAPELISRLVLVDAIGLRVPGAPIADQFAMGPQEKIAALFHDPAAAADLFPENPDLDTLTAFYRDETAFARYAWSPFCCNPKLAKRLYRISAPTLVLWGGDDRLVPLSHGEKYAAMIPDAELQVIPDAGHAVLMERPKEAVQAIVRFLER
ncbi:MAG: alpha/beta fold hydrolase [Caulobacteraceae bacterium]